MEHPVTILGYVCVACALAAILVIAGYLWKRPALDFAGKMWLLLGLGLLPGMSAASSTVTGMEATTKRHFCGSCHVMDPYVGDASDPSSQSLAARHGRNPFFGDRNCYVCHADYGMYGYPLTKLNGMNHVYQYYLNGWKDLTIEQALDRIHLNKPYDNTNCRQCHTGTLADWSSVPEHVSLAVELEANVVSCASSGCHGYAHPFSKDDGDHAPALPKSAIGSDDPSAERERAADRDAAERARREQAREAAKKAGSERSKEAP